MDEKNQSESIWEEALNKFKEEVEKVANVIEEAFSSLFGRVFPQKEDGWEMKCPFEEGEEYWLLHFDGTRTKEVWENHTLDESALLQNNAFKTREAALLEADRRFLLSRFKAFRDECNDGWKPDMTDATRKKYYLSYSEIKNGVYVSYIVLGNHLHTFGYFKNEKDAEHAIELFGDEIKELFVDCEEE